MESSQILITGIGGLGCIWAARAHQRGAGASLLMLDADDRFPEAEGANIIRLGHTLDALGCAALPPLAEQRMRGLATRTRPFLEQAELVIIVAGLGGGTGTGAPMNLHVKRSCTVQQFSRLRHCRLKVNLQERKLLKQKFNVLNIIQMFASDCHLNDWRDKHVIVERTGAWVQNGLKISSMVWSERFSLWASSIWI